MLKQTAVLFLLAILAAGMLVGAGCAPDPVQTPERTALTGGDGRTAENVNLREVSVEVQGEHTNVHLSFINGSRFAGAEETKASAVPCYEISTLADPPRICVSLDVAYTDYAQAGTVFQGSVVNGLFDCALADGTTQLFLQLAEPADVSVREEGAVLTLELTPQATQPVVMWYVGLNAMAQYISGTVPADLHFSPTLCQDFSRSVLISKPFRTEQTAEDFRIKAAAELPAAVPESALYLFEMSTDGLPPYEDIAAADLAAAVSVLEMNGVPAALPVVLDNGSYLTTGPDGTIVYAVPYLPEGREDADGIVKEEVWGRRPDGSLLRYGAQDFCDIRSAAFSADGRFLALLDNTIDSQILYIYDGETALLQNLGEEGFGDLTASFAWAAPENVIYAMTGTGTAVQLLRYDFSAPEGQRVSSVAERPGADSLIAYANGRIYYSDQAAMRIYTVDAVSGARSELMPGVTFALSADGRYLAVLTVNSVSEVGYTFDLVIADAQTGDVLQTVIEGVQVENLMFAPDSDTLYFLTPEYEGVSEDYPFALLAYSVSMRETQLIGYSKSELIRTSLSPDELYITYYFVSGQASRDILPVTYLLTRQGS